MQVRERLSLRERSPVTDFREHVAGSVPRRCASAAPTMRRRRRRAAERTLLGPAACCRRCVRDGRLARRRLDARARVALAVGARVLFVAAACAAAVADARAGAGPRRCRAGRRAQLLFRRPARRGGRCGRLSSMGGIAAVAVVLVVGRAARGAARRLADAVAPAGWWRSGSDGSAASSPGAAGTADRAAMGRRLPGARAAPRHPLQLYSAAFDLRSPASCAARRAARAVAARAVGLGSARLLLETLRDPSAADPPIGGLPTPRCSVRHCSCAGGIAAAVWLRRSRPRMRAGRSPERLRHRVALSKAAAERLEWPVGACDIVSRCRAGAGRT